jgi:predicted small secreted protein
MQGSCSTGNNTIREGGAILKVAMDDDDNLSSKFHMRSNIVESNVTEGLPSLPPVESKVMDCHAMRGSGSTGSDTIKEGGAILEVAMDDDDDLSTEFHMQGNIIESDMTEGLKSLPSPVESKVTACHTMHGSGSTREDTIREGRAILEVVMDDDDDLSIESDVTEGLPSLPPVESKVTACHTMRGSGSTGNDTIREGGANLKVAMDDDNDDLSSEFLMRGNIIESNITEGLPSRPLVESKVTSCHAATSF